MAGRRFLYLTVLAGCLGFYYAYREWFAWFLLVGAFFLPLLCLIISLPAMLKVQVRLHMPGEVPIGSEALVRLESACSLPTPPIRCKLRVRHSVTGEEISYATETPLPTQHCGALRIIPKKLYVYDYLGLFRRRIRKIEPLTLHIAPKPIPLAEPPQLRQYLSNSWRPKPGGGFAENYDLRQYRPGDNLRQIHWKLAAKTGDLIYREPMEPMKNTLVICLILPATEEQLDEDLGKLLWLSGYLLEQQLTHEIRCLTGRGLECFPVKDLSGQKNALRALLASPAAPKDAELSEPVDAVWHYRIGGDPDAV